MIDLMELFYRVIDVAAGDLGGLAARKFDCEAGADPGRTARSPRPPTARPSRRRPGTRFKGEAGNEVAATLNGTLATTRWLVAILENHQQADGSVVVPEGCAHLSASTSSARRSSSRGEPTPAVVPTSRMPSACLRAHLAWARRCEFSRSATTGERPSPALARSDFVLFAAVELLGLFTRVGPQRRFTDPDHGPEMGPVADRLAGRRSSWASSVALASPRSSTTCSWSA